MEIGEVTLRQFDAIGVTIRGTKHRPILLCAQDVAGGSGQDYVLVVHVRLVGELQELGGWNDITRLAWEKIKAYRRPKATGKDDIELTVE